MAKQIDLCFSWTWEYDADLNELLKQACANAHRSFLDVTKSNVENVIHDLVSGDLEFKMVYDRASDEDHQFLPITNWAKEHKAFLVNDPEKSLAAEDKMAMHHALINAGVRTPHTIFLPSFVEQPEIHPIDLGALKGKFIIKPAHGAGGEGVKVEADSWDTVLEARREFPDEIYLLQVNINPGVLNERPSWFRVLYCFEEKFICWWSPKSHRYDILMPENESELNLGDLRNIADIIARTSGLNIFSTEIALTQDRVFVVVDYVNDPIDLRLQSKYKDAIPDDLVKQVVATIVNHIPQ
jgi:hypothetical protein